MIHEAHASLFDNRYAGTLPFHAPHEPVAVVHYALTSANDAQPRDPRG